jgi:hypothetical protein
VTPLLASAYAAEIVAAVAGLALARRHPKHRPAAVALTLLAVLSLLGMPVREALGPPTVEPIDGVRRVFVYLDGARKLGVFAILPGLALATCSERPRRAVGALVAVWALASVVLAVLYPSPLVRGEGLRRVYLAADLLCLAGVAVAFASWARLRRSPSSAHVVAVVLAFLDLATLINPLGPYRAGLFGVPFDPVQVTILVGFVAVALYQGVLWRFSSPSS